MCTIGAVFNGDNILTFKQCDLIPVTVFNEPDVRVGSNGVGSYIAMTRQGSSGIWFSAAKSRTRSSTATLPSGT